MATSKPTIQSTLDTNTYKKLQVIQKKLKRNKQSDIVRYIVEDWIENYEQQHGPITLPTASQETNPEDERT